MHNSLSGASPVCKGIRSSMKLQSIQSSVIMSWMLKLVQGKEDTSICLSKKCIKREFQYSNHNITPSLH